MSFGPGLSRKRSLDDYKAKDEVQCTLCDKRYEFWYLKEFHYPNEHKVKYDIPKKKGFLSVNALKLL